MAHAVVLHGRLLHLLHMQLALLELDESQLKRHFQQLCSQSRLDSIDGAKTQLPELQQHVWTQLSDATHLVRVNVQLGQVGKGVEHHVQVNGDEVGREAQRLQLPSKLSQIMQDGLQAVAEVKQSQLSQLGKVDAHVRWEAVDVSVEVQQLQLARQALGGIKPKAGQLEATKLQGVWPHKPQALGRQPALFIVLEQVQLQPLVLYGGAETGHVQLRQILVAQKQLLFHLLSADIPLVENELLKSFQVREGQDSPP